MSTTSQDAIETACHNAIHAMHREAARAHREQRSPEACLILAAALEQLLADDDIMTIEHISRCERHLRRQAAPRRGDS